MGTLWSFYHHIFSADDIVRIVHNQLHAELIWNELKIEEDEDENEEIKNIMTQQIVLPSPKTDNHESNDSLLSSIFLSSQIEGNVEQKMSDSEDFYESAEEEQVKKIDTPTTNNGSAVNLMAKNFKTPKGKMEKMQDKNIKPSKLRKRKSRRRKKKNVYIENVKLKEENIASPPKLNKRKSRKRKKKKINIEEK